ncbi:hypothetical protein D3C72_2120630 [compost metagenome]
MRFTREHPAEAADFKRCFITLLLLKLDASLSDSAQLIKHRLLSPRVPGHQNVQLLLHKIHALSIVPQAVFQQDKIDWGDGVSPAK